MFDDLSGVHLKADFDSKLLALGRTVRVHKDLSNQNDSTIRLRSLKEGNVFKFSQLFELKNGDVIELEDDRSFWKVLSVEDYRVGNIYVSFNATTSRVANSPREIKITGAETEQEERENEITDSTPRQLIVEDYSKKIFVVHGHDDQARTELELLLYRADIQPVLLDKQANQGLTLIEKLENNSDVGYAFILMTPDEIAYLANQENVSDQERFKELRPRPNVWIELGYFMGRLNRKRICFLIRGDISLPSDLRGILYHKFNKSIEEKKIEIFKELKSAGYEPRQ